MILVESNATEEEISLVSKNKTSLYDARSLCTTSMNGYWSDNIIWKIYIFGGIWIDLMGLGGTSSTFRYYTYNQYILTYFGLVYN